MGKNPVSKAKLLAASALLGYVLTAMSLWGGQARLIFEPDRQMRASPADFPFAVVETAVPVRGSVRAPQTIYGWWIPAASSKAKVVLYLHGNDGNISTSVREIA